MNTKQLAIKLKKKSPKTWAKIEAGWESKMMWPVMQFVVDLDKYITNKYSNYSYNGNAIETEVWKLLKKARRLK